MEKETLRLFKSYLGEKSEKIEFSEEGLKHGLLIPNTASDIIVKNAIELYGKDGEKWNQTFHKDFEIVKNAPIEDLIAQQMIHYMTTYGFESLGFYDSDLVYIPNEKLEIPELDKESGVEFVTIRPITNEELQEKLMVLLTSGIALSEQTVKDIMVLSDFIDKDRFDEIKNREIKTTLYNKYNIMPRNPEEFLRFLLFKTTGETLKIQNDKMIGKIKESDRSIAIKMLNSYLDKTPNGYEKLSSIFLRNKNLFLAFKEKDNKSINSIINKLRKVAKHSHKPLKKDILDCLTNYNVDIDIDLLKTRLNDITPFREMRILNGIRYRLLGNNNIVYIIRNGKSYVSEIDMEHKDFKYIEKLSLIYNTIYEHLLSRIQEKVKDKTIYIPNNVVYAVPTSEKQFNGNIPEGSYLEVPRNGDMVYGVHWTNIENGDPRNNGFYGKQKRSGNEEQVDLDLKQMNKSEIFGWDASYRSGNDIQFSGDMTDAPLPKGATELFHIGNKYGHGAFLITLNMYSSNSQDVPFEFVIAKGESSDIRKNYVIDPNNILGKVDMVVKKDARQMVVGFITIGDNIRFYFNDFSAGASKCTSRQDNITMGAFDYLQAYSKTQLKLNDLLKDCGAIISDKPTIREAIEEVNEQGEEILTIKEKNVDIDLSLNNITKETIINLFN